MKNRNYCFTIFGDWNFVKHKDISYICFQKELCPSTNKLHYQGYIELSKPSRMNYVKDLLNCKNAHLEKRLGTQQQAIDYCKKDSGVPGSFFECGTKSNQGKRNDLNVLLSELKDKKLNEFCIENPSLTIKYSKGIQFLKNCFDSVSLVNRDVHVSVLIGPPGCGKTRFAYDTYSDIYKLNTNTNNTLWFDGYNDNKVLLIDDFSGWIRFTELLTILDRYPYRCQLKGGYCWAKWDKVIITSNYPICNWYSDVNASALKRRINFIRTEWDEVKG